MRAKEMWTALAGVVLTTLILSTLSSLAAKGLIAVWDKTPPEEVQTVRVYVGTNSGDYHLQYDVDATFNKLAFYFDFLSEEQKVTWTNDYQNAGIFALPYTNYPVYYMAASAIGFNGLESELSNEVVVTNRPPPLKSFGILQVDLQTARVGFTNVPPLMNISWSTNLIDWHDLLEIAIYDFNELPWVLDFLIYTTNCPARFYRLQDLTEPIGAVQDLGPSLPGLVYHEEPVESVGLLSLPPLNQYR